MKRLISLPKSCIPYFRSIYPDPDIYTSHDPEGQQVGSGGGLIHLLKSYQKEHQTPLERRIVINAGGESRRLPAYGSYGKVLLPIPILKWSRGQRVDQRLFDLQCDYLDRIYQAAPPSLSTIVASGDAFITLPEQLSPLPHADIVCLGLWGDAQTATKHGVFVCERNDASLVQMLQKPDIETLNKESKKHHLLIDSGVWLLSDRAIQALTTMVDESPNGFVDLYTDFGATLGSHPRHPSIISEGLTTAVWIVEEAKFFHFGSNHDLLASLHTLQNMVVVQDTIMPSKWTIHDSIFALNANIAHSFRADNHQIWIENSTIPGSWKLTGKHILTGIPDNNCAITLPEGICIDIAPINEGNYCVRVYGFDDSMRGALGSSSTQLMGQPAKEVIEQLGITGLSDDIDLFDSPIHPIVKDESEALEIVNLILSGKKLPSLQYLSPRELLSRIHLIENEKRRQAHLSANLIQMRRHHTTSVYFQSDLTRIGDLSLSHGITLSESDLSSDRSQLTIMHEEMLKAYINKTDKTSSQAHTDKAYAALREVLSASIERAHFHSYSDIHSDQIVWARSPVRIDLAGGWTDTPPYCIYEGGRVINAAVTINRQEPLQIYVKKSDKSAIVLRSIDLGAEEVITDIKALNDYHRIGSPFAIPKAALTLCGIGTQKSSKEMIDALGGGIEITMLSALPAGSGLGVSSILASTTLAALNEYFGLGWDQHRIGISTLLLEQLLTTCGGWQDQYGGIYGGLKLLTTSRGTHQLPEIQWLSDRMFTQPDYAQCHLLLYTGITRIAKHILGNIVENMFLNNHQTLALLGEMREHTNQMSDIISRGDLSEYGRLIRQSWAFNKQLDAGTSTADIERLCQLIDDYALGYKLTGAGGGGFMYIVAKDPEAATLIRHKVNREFVPIQPSARFVEMSLSIEGIQVTKS